LIEPSYSLRQILDELDTRKTTKAIGHFQASLFNPEMNHRGKPNMSALYHRIPPHERTYLYQLSENRKQDLQNPRRQTHTQNQEAGQMPRESESLREYLSHLSRIERRLLNDEIIRLEINVQAGPDRDGLTITEARSLIPEQSVRDIRLRARDLAWERLASREISDGNPRPETARINDTIAHIHEHLQEKARIAQNARNGFLAEKIFEAERAIDSTGPKSDLQARESREKFVQSVISGLSREDKQRLGALDIYAAQTREEVYRGFREIDDQLRDLKQSRTQVEIRRIESGASINRDNGSYPIEFAGIDQEWHFDSLRDVLSPDRKAHHSPSQERPVQPERLIETNDVFQR
jgi:hypothetical protein